MWRICWGRWGWRGGEGGKGGVDEGWGGGGGVVRIDKDRSVEQRSSGK